MPTTLTGAGRFSNNFGLLILQSSRLDTIPSVGPVIASALRARCLRALSISRAMVVVRRAQDPDE